MDPGDPQAQFESLVQAEGERLFREMETVNAPSIFSKKGTYSRLMEWAMRDSAFKTQLFRFVDVLPSLQNSSEVVRHLQEYLGDRAVELSPPLKAGLAVAGLAPALVAAPVKSQISSVAREFVAGETADDVVRRFHANTKQGIATTVDLLGETVVSEREADLYLRRNLDVLGVLAASLQRAPEAGFSDIGPHGLLPRINLSLKISALAPEVNPADPDGMIELLKPRLREIFRTAAKVGAFINVDMESYRFKALTFAVFKSLLEEPEFAAKPDAGIAVQAYLRDAEADLDALIAWSRTRRRPVTVRLVKGAYWDHETVLAQQRNWPVPVWSEKWQTDENYEKLSRRLVAAYPDAHGAFATHNVRSCAHAIALARQAGLDPRAIEFQLLYGMADDLKSALLKNGYRVREYCPVGELLPGMAYLVRRLLENTSNEGFLLRRRHGHASWNELLAPPRPPPDEPGRPTRQSAPPLEEFRNAPNTDFTDPRSRDHMRAALRRLSETTAGDHSLLIGGKARAADHESIASLNPAHPSQVIGRWTRATVQDADDAVRAARAAQPAWARLAGHDRACAFERAADLLEKQRFDFAALEVVEAGKPWVEADADVSEAIDFCRYYAGGARRLGTARRTQQVPGELNLEYTTPRGVGVVISPWNFPLAILCGMTAAAAVTGNTVIVKPAEQTSIIAARFCLLLQEAGIPPGVINLLTGYGEDVGAHLVAHAGVDFVCFTGSRAVGLNLWETVGRTSPGQRNLKHAICEMGGKNALIVDADCDWDETIPAVLYSAFGFSGQKCSALSRLIIHADIAEGFTERLIAAAASLRIGDPIHASTTVGPVIDADAHRKITSLVRDAERTATKVFEARLTPELLASGGYYVAPAIFTNVARGSQLEREEVFGPVLTIFGAGNFDEAIALANDSEYALTAGVFSRSPTHLAKAAAELDAGNVYLNRAITGAMVARHPFGGHRMSGGGTKAGGPQYLDNFVFRRVVSENTLRRGFVPPAAET
jgi:RHH-type transcriptional regulator, proline utilization regulon repressor / proline dehydrogenase / delta 1-pyrroline-5-carboxylate dehydrogenase